MTDYSERGHAMRIKWNKAENMFRSFFTDLIAIRDEIGDEALPHWCVTHLRLGISVINRVSDILTSVDASVVKDNLRRARESEQAAKRAERERQQEAAAQAVQAREAARKQREANAKAAKQAAQRAKNPDRNADWRWRRVAAKGIPELTMAVHNGEISLSTAADIAQVPRDMQLTVLTERSGNPKYQPQKRRKQSKPQSPKPSDELDELRIAIVAGKAEAEGGKKQWITGTMKAAVAMYKARKKFSSNNEFGAWLTRYRITYSDDDRAALINMGEHPTLTLAVLQRTERSSYRLIWTHEIQPQTHTSNTAEVIPLHKSAR